MLGEQLCKMPPLFPSFGGFLNSYYWYEFFVLQLILDCITVNKEYTRISWLKKAIHVLPTTKPVIGPQSQINEEKACSIPSVCKTGKKGSVKHELEYKEQKKDPLKHKVIKA